MVPLPVDNNVTSGAKSDQISGYAFPLAPFQRLVWNDRRHKASDPVYNAAFRFRLSGPLQAEVLYQAFKRLLARHEVLRASFHLLHGKPVQLISDEFDFSLSCNDLRDEKNLQGAVNRVSIEEASQPFELSRGPLIRVTLLRTAEEEHIMLLTLHHLICDGWSVNLILSELASNYSSLALGLEPDAPPLELQFTDYAVWLTDGFSQESLNSQREYWRVKLRDLPDFTLPSGHARRPGAQTGGRILSDLIPRAVSDAVAAMAQSFEGTMFSVSLAVFKAVLHRLTSASDVVVGTPFAGRSFPEVEGVIGPFINPVILRTRVESHQQFHQLMRACRETLDDAMANKDIPYDELLEQLSKDAAPGAQGYRINFVCQRELTKSKGFGYQAGKVQISTVPSKSQGALYDLQVFLIERPEGWRLSCEYDVELYDEETGRTIIEAMQAAFAAIVRNPSLTIADIPLETKPAEVRANRTICAPASLSQQRYALLEALSPGSGNTSACVRIRGVLDGSKLERAAQLLAARHEILRTSFRSTANGLEQVIHATASPEFVVEQVRSQHPEKDLPGLIQSHAGRPFDLNRGPLWNLRLYRLEKTSYVLVVTVHHILADGWSQGIIQRELWANYESLLKETPSGMERPALQYAMVGAWQSANARERTYNDDLTYWKEYLKAPIPVVSLVPGKRRNARAAARCAVELLRVPASLVQTWRSFCPTAGVTGFVFTLACFKALLYRFTAETDLVVASPVAQRSCETENVIGPFAAPMAFRTRIHPKATFLELLAAVSEAVREGLSHSAVPFDVLESELNVKPVNGRNPLFQFYFTYQKEFVTGRNVGGLEIETYPMPPAFTPYEVQIGFIERPSGVDMRMDYDPDVIDSASVRILLGKMLDLIGEVLKTPEREIDALRAIAGGSPFNEMPTSAAGLPRVEQNQYVRPRTPDEKLLVKIWEQVLGIAPIGIRTKFFDLGGYSLALLRLFAQVNKTFGTSLPATTIFKYPTVETLAKHLRAKNQQHANDIVVPIKDSGSNPPFFMVHSYHLYADLPWLLDPEQPFYGLQEMGRVDHSGGYALETMMAEYVRCIRQIQPHGPYLLGGFCSAALPAFEVSRQLEAGGEQVALLALIESPTTAVSSVQLDMPLVRRIGDYFSRRKRELAFYRETMRPLRWPERARYSFNLASRKLHNLSSKWELWGWSRACRFYLRLGLQLPGVIQRKLCSGIRVVTLEAIRGYQPKMYHGRIDLLVGSDAPAQNCRTDAESWNRLTSGGVTVTLVPGDHDSMFVEPHLSTFAAKLRQLIGESLSPEMPERHSQGLRAAHSDRC